MGNYRYTDEVARIYHRPEIGIVEPGDMRALESAPDDGHWQGEDDSPEFEPDADSEENDK